MRIALASFLIISVLGQPVPAAAATLTTPAPAVASVGVIAGFSPCGLFPFLPWCR
jgi:hypothetical protein